MANSNSLKTYRKVKRIFTPTEAKEGAGVRLKRIIGNHKIDNIDPFLLLDEFRSDNPDDYIAGFPFHPHRGIETITYMIHGSMRHRDSLGNNGVIETGGAQWMTAGKGIMHEEIPEQADGMLWGYQLWLNLPKAHKMIAPKYQDLKSHDIPIINHANGVTVKILSGELDGVKGPVCGGFLDPVYLDIEIPAGRNFSLAVNHDDTYLAYIISGQGEVIENHTKSAEAFSDGLLIEFTSGDMVSIQAAANSTGKSSLRLLLIGARPLNEPIARYGPFVMNTEEEIRETIAEIQAGVFGS